MTSFNQSVVPPLRLTFLMWLVFSIEFYLGLELTVLGIYPRTWHGAIGIVTAPLIHGDVKHLASNTFPLIFLGMTLYLFYNRIASQVFIQCYFFTGILVWLLGRPSYHIGASGLVYGLAFFLISFGVFRKDFKSLIISVVIIIFYGGLIPAVFDIKPQVSWESHLMGAIVGVGTAVAMSRRKRNFSD